RAGPNPAHQSRTHPGAGRGGRSPRAWGPRGPSRPPPGGGWPRHSPRRPPAAASTTTSRSDRASTKWRSWHQGVQQGCGALEVVVGVGVYHDQCGRSRTNHPPPAPPVTAGRSPLVATKLSGRRQPAPSRRVGVPGISDHEDQSIAIVGAACRLPGGIENLDQLWQALTEARDLVGAAPTDRFDLGRFTDRDLPRPGKGYTTAGGYLTDLAGFDAGHFGISPREAAQMDPQHRLLLELAAEALDDAAIAPESLAGTDTAVFVGISDASYGGLQMANLSAVNAYTMSGGASSIAANRISYSFDLHGPSMAVDTACSSALVALDQACRAVLDGTSRTVLCGAVNALVSPYPYVGFSQASMLSRRGRCSAFSANADGFVRAEGGGLVVLKRLADARADGDRIHAVILASGSNCDGRTMGLSLPNADTQEELLRTVYRRAGVHPDDLAYFEAHGTGTPVGDPIECSA